MRKWIFIFLCILIHGMVRGQTLFELPDLPDTSVNTDMKGGRYHYWFDNNKTAAREVAISANSAQLTIAVDTLDDWFHTIHLCVQDKNGSWSETLTRSFAVLPKSFEGYSVNTDLKGGNYCYWFDNNNANIKQMTIDANAAVIDIPVDSIDDWFHTIHVYVVDKEGSKSETLTRSFAVLPKSFESYAADTDVKGGTYYYWFDSNTADAHQISIEANAAVVDIPVDSIDDWFHTIHFCVIDKEGNKTETLTRSFCVVPKSFDGYTADTDLTKGGSYYYWFDADTEGAVKMPIADNAAVVDIPVDNIDDWFHTIHICVIDTAGNYSETYTRSFCVVPKDFSSAHADTDLTGGKYRYWFDNSQAAIYEDVVTGNVMDLDIPVDSLPDWFHSIHFQVCDKGGNWSEVQTKRFYIQPSKMLGITGYVYWINDDWNGRQSVSFSEPVNSFDFADQIDVVAYPVRPSAFKFVMEDGKPSVQAVNDFHIRFQTAWGDMAEGVAQFLDESTQETVTDIMPLTPDEGQSFDVPEKNKINWYSVDVLAGDKVSLKTDKKSVLQVFSSKADEVYHADAAESTVEGGFTAPEDGIYYLAVHDVVSGGASTQLIDYLLTESDRHLLLGDVNADRAINVGDLVQTVNYIIGNNPIDFRFELADMDRNNTLDVSDLVQIIRIITGERATERGYRIKAQQLENNDCLTASFENGMFNLSLENAVPYSAFQFALTLPEGISVTSTVLNAARNAGHVVSVGRLEDGRVMVVAYSAANQAFRENEGSLLDLFTSDVKGGSIEVDDIMFVTPQGHVRRFAPITIDTATGIQDVELVGAVKGYYDISGRRLDNAPTRKGIYIHNGKKITVK
ncbi:MAG: Ig-like domain repeat protein [Bacteroidaceae bacterium]|nr:Ig-like domain repeat protein [Bacteroidaceae bacterium]